MPIENENKYVLRLLPHLENKIGSMASHVFKIEQSYLLKNKGLTVRIRKQLGRKGKVKYFFTTKQRVGSRVVEIEKRINESDYNELAKVSSGWLNKVRYVIDSWEVDFFKNGVETYFIMAEIEMPDGQDEPARVPSFVSDYLIYKVSKDDFRFSSKKLSDVDYSKTLLQEVVSQADGNSDDLGEFKVY